MLHGKQYIFKRGKKISKRRQNMPNGFMFLTTSYKQAYATSKTDLR